MMKTMIAVGPLSKRQTASRVGAVVEGGADLSFSGPQREPHIVV
jgi:hypothetical protein